ncbi:MAG: 5'/3'-nucleotidase SurE [Haloarculaceae archaeon]
MADGLRILLTNDDGIDEPGLYALHDALSELGEVVAVAPAREQSAVGRSLSYGRGEDGELGVDFAGGAFSYRIAHAEHDLGYALEGTPCDCVIAGVNALVEDPDIVVSGCNPGANLGAHVLARSGTASAAMEAAVLGVPSMAVSMDTLGLDREVTVDDFDAVGRFTRRLVEHALDAGVFEDVDYLNVNAPRPDGPIDRVEITRPSPVYEMDATYEEGVLTVHNRLWEQMMADRDLPDPEGTDRHAIKAGHASISPLTVPHLPSEHDALDAFADVTVEQ